VTTKVEDVLRRLDFKGAPPPTDPEVSATCPRCDKLQTLRECTVGEDDRETTYTCKSGCRIVVVVGVPGSTP
jgi:transcription elongation factor Elf1